MCCCAHQEPERAQPQRRSGRKQVQRVEEEEEEEDEEEDESDDDGDVARFARGMKRRRERGTGVC